MYGLPKYQLSKLQRVMNASARLVYCAPKSCHITPLRRELHWLPVCYRIEYITRKLIVFTRAAPAFDNLFMGCVFNINTVHKTVEKLTFQAFY